MKSLSLPKNPENLSDTPSLIRWSLFSTSIFLANVDASRIHASRFTDVSLNLIKCSISAKPSLSLEVNATRDVANLISEFLEIASGAVK